MYLKLTACFFALLYFTGFAVCQNNTGQPTTNNLVFANGYKTGVYGAIPQYIKKGRGKQTLILIAGLGFNVSVFNDFMAANSNKYTMYAVTIAGYGTTKAPPMPPAGTSYGAQYWNKGAGEGIMKLIEKKKLQKPVIAGSYVQGSQLALRLAMDYPDKIGGVITLGGPAKFIYINPGGQPMEYPLKSTVAFIDSNSAPKWFGTINKQSFDDGNYAPEVYSLDSVTGNMLWKQVALVPLPIMIRYLCEFFASDITLELDKIKCPVLVLRAAFNTGVLQKKVNNYVKPQFIDSWGKAAAKNALLQVKDITNAGAFIWKDNPNDTYNSIDAFMQQLNNQ
jgi:pimeloyl-ACP methyl ester carboxylesterase